MIKIRNTFRHALSIMTASQHTDIAVMDNFTNYFTNHMGHLTALLDLWDHQLSIEYKVDIV